MSAVIEDCRGTVHMVGTSGAGFYKLDPDIVVNGDGKCLILGIPLALQEIVQPTVTLDDKRTLYVFGSAWNESSVTGMLLLGKNSGGGGALQDLLSWYETHRVSKSADSVRLSMGTGGVDAYVTGLRLEAADEKFNTQMFSLTLILPGNS